jgi:outer membrane protein assembly factor BamD
MFPVTPPSKLASLVFALFLFGGCASQQTNDSDPEILFKEAESDISSDRYLGATEKLQLVKNKFPYSRFASLAQLRLADVYFLQESFMEAAASYEVFRELHPKHEKAGYAAYRIGESYLNEAPTTVPRDLSSAARAETAFDFFIRTFPKDPQVQAAIDGRAKARALQAEKELLIAKFYRRQDQFISAEGRLEKLLSKYKETPSAKEAEDLLARVKPQADLQRKVLAEQAEKKGASR